MKVMKSGYLATGYLGIAIDVIEGLGAGCSNEIADWRKALAEAGDYVSENKMIEFIECFSEHVDLSSFFFDFGERLILETHGFLGYAAKSSHNVREALMMDVYFLRTQLSFLEFNLSIENGFGELRIKLQGVASNYPQYFMECILSSLYAMYRQISQSELSVDAYFEYKRPSNAEAYQSRIPCKSHFGADRNAIVFPARYLDLVLASKDENLKKLAERQCSEKMTELPKDDSLSEKIRRYFIDSDAEYWNQPALAKYLNVSESTLKRRLSKERTNFRTLVEKARESKAKKLLGNDDMELSSIAEALGYTETSTFIKAFNRWTGKTPTEYRRDKGNR